MKHQTKFLVGVFLLVACFCRTGPAVPRLQLYSPQAFYNSASESWLTYENPFDLWVVGAPRGGASTIIDDVMLYVALPGFNKDTSGLGPSLTISTTAPSGPPTTTDNNPLAPWTLTLEEADLVYGQPPWRVAGLPPHGVYPAYYWAIDLDQLAVADAGETVYDFNENFDPNNPAASGEDEDPGKGDIQYYQISYAPYHPDISLHFDATGIDDGPGQGGAFAPFSHDAEAAFLPEPGTFALGLLAVAGCAGAFWIRRRTG